MSMARQQADRFAAAVTRAGGQAHVRHAQTGTVYVAASGQDGSITARFANHGECYCREDISVDPDGASYAGALRAAARATGLDLRRSLAACQAAATRQARAAAEEAAQIAAARAAAASRDAARVAFRDAYVADKLAGARASKNRLKRLRQEANRAFYAE